MKLDSESEKLLNEILDDIPIVLANKRRLEEKSNDINSPLYYVKTFKWDLESVLARYMNGTLTTFKTQPRGRKKALYAIYDLNNEFILSGNGPDCAKYLGVSLPQFYNYYNKTQRCNYRIEKIY